MWNLFYVVGVLILVEVAYSQNWPSESTSYTGNSGTNSGSQKSSNSNSISVPSFTKSLSKFSVDFYEAIISKNTENVIMSPLSAQTALSLLYCGAAGQTQSIMAKSLDYSYNNQNAIANQFQQLLQSIENDPIITIANAIYLMQGFTIQPTYLKIARNKFYSKIANVDFNNNYKAASIINNWVAMETNNKITNLISPDYLNGATRLVILNAIYFKGAWKHKFPLYNTQSKLFYGTSRSSPSSVQMMRVINHFQYAYIDALQSQVIELPYNNSDISMVLILPKTKTGLPNLEQRLINYDLSNLDSQLYDRKVDLSMPKFKIETSLNLNNPLMKLGLGNIYSDDADFSKILVERENLQVSQVVQKAYIEVDEKGATAAAATGIIIGALAIAPSPSVSMKANHPFIFLLKTIDTILFIGTYTNEIKTNS